VDHVGQDSARAPSLADQVPLLLWSSGWILLDGARQTSIPSKKYLGLLTASGCLHGSSRGSKHFCPGVWMDHVGQDSARAPSLADRVPLLLWSSGWILLDGAKQTSIP